MTRGLLTIAAVLGFTTLLFQQDMSSFYKSFMGKKPPALEAEEAHWLNTKVPVTAAALAGKVVWIEFSFVN